MYYSFRYVYIFFLMFKCLFSFFLKIYVFVCLFICIVKQDAFKQWLVETAVAFELHINACAFCTIAVSAHFAQAGALRHFVWQAWHLVTLISVSRGGRLCSRLTGKVCPTMTDFDRNFCVPN